MIKIVIIIQNILLYLSFFFFKFQRCDKKKIVIGVTEIANNIFSLGNVFKNNLTVNFVNHKFYKNNKYDYILNNKWIINKYLKLLYGPILLGYLANKAGIFFYIWSDGFLLDRKYDFKFLKSKKKKIICLFVGDDIRSLKLSNNYSKKNEIDISSTYRYKQMDLNNGYHENKKKYIAYIADKYADLIFNNSKDQITYLKSKQHEWIYIYDKKKFFKNDQKFKKIKKINIFHAKSNPLNKGTPLVRAAIKKLQLEGYKFCYIEPDSVSNKTVLKYLRNSHIVLNQFYAFSPGLFGVEAMANHCAVMMSAEPKDLFSKTDNKDELWMVTKYWQIYDNLKYLLENPKKIKYYADRSFDFASKNFTYETSREYLYKVFEKNEVL